MSRSTRTLRLAGLLGLIIAGNAVAETAITAKDAQAILAEHNRIRAEVEVPPLAWSDTVADGAQRWADKLAQSCELKHNALSRYGQNLFMGTDGYYGVRDAALNWEEEKSQYHGGRITAENWHPSGHYTQMVWRLTQRLGCGKAICRGQVIVVCDYDPRGNILNQPPY